MANSFLDIDGLTTLVNQLKAYVDKNKGGETPYIKDGNWWIGDEDTGVKAEGTDGKDGTDGTNGLDGKDGIDGVTTILQGMGMTTNKSLRLESGETYEIKPDTIVMVNGDNFKQTIVDKNGTVLIDSENKALPQFGGGLFFNTSTEDGFRSNMMVVSGSYLGTTITNKNFDATEGNIFIKAGATPTWIFYTDTSVSSYNNFKNTGTNAIQFMSNNTNSAVPTITINGNTEQGGNITLRTSESSNNAVIDLWAKNDDTSRIIIRNEADTLYSTIGVGDVAIIRDGVIRSLSNVIPWGYSLKIVTTLPSPADSKTIYIVTG